MIIYTPPKPADHPQSIPIIGLSGGGLDLPGARSRAGKSTRPAATPASSTSPTMASRRTCCKSNWTGQALLRPAARRAKLAIELEKSAAAWATSHARQVLDEGSAPDLKEAFMYLAAAPRPARAPDGAVSYPKSLARDLPGFQTDLATYGHHMGTLSRRLMRLIALSLDLDETISTRLLPVTRLAVRLLHYPPQESAGFNNQLGAGAHTDWGAITLLLQDDAGGLEVRNAAGDWVRASPVPGTLRDQSRRSDPPLDQRPLPIHPASRAQQGCRPRPLTRSRPSAARITISASSACRPAVPSRASRIIPSARSAST